MNVKTYIYTINKNNSFKLDPDELKDVEQEISIYLSQKNYNNLLVKKTILSFYIKASTKKQKREDYIKTGEYLEISHSDTHEIEKKRLEEIKKLNLNSIQSKIIELLVKGFSYLEIRKKLKLNCNQLSNQVKRIKQTNSKQKSGTLAA